MKTLATLSNGKTFNSPKPLKKRLSKLKRLQRSLSRRLKGPHNRAQTKDSLCLSKNKLIADRWFPSSKIYSKCGEKKEELKLSERVYHCAACGHEQDRDLNAAINLKNLLSQNA